MPTISSSDLATSRFVETMPQPAIAGAKKVVILIPGIRTNADWIDAISERAESFSDLLFKKAYGGHISEWQLFARYGLNKVRSSISKQINSILRDNPGAEFSLICHSMGTDLIYDILSDDNLYFKNIIFLGSILRWNKSIYISKHCDNFINHRGNMDHWPIIASIVRPYRYSPSGTFGFSSAAYVNDFMFDNDHITCTEADHIFNYVRPILLGSPVKSPSHKGSVFGYNFFQYARMLFYPSIFVLSIFLICSIYFLFEKASIYFLIFLYLPILLLSALLVSVIYVFYFKGKSKQRTGVR